MRTQNLSPVVAGLVVGLGVVAACGSAGTEANAPPAEITLAITSPAPGAELLAADQPSIVVSGTVTTTDRAHGALEAWVNGVQVDVTDGAFTTQIAPEVGVNHIRVEGGDGSRRPSARSSM